MLRAANHLQADSNIIQKYQENDTYETCPNCSRQFFKGRLNLHLKSCRKERPFKASKKAAPGHITDSENHYNDTNELRHSQLKSQSSPNIAKKPVVMSSPQLLKSQTVETESIKTSACNLWKKKFIFFKKKKLKTKQYSITKTLWESRGNIKIRYWRWWWWWWRQSRVQ